MPRYITDDELNDLTQKQHHKELAMDYDKGITATGKVEITRIDYVIYVEHEYDTGDFYLINSDRVREAEDLAKLLVPFTTKPRNCIDLETEAELYEYLFLTPEVDKPYTLDAELPQCVEYESGKICFIQLFPETYEI